METKNNGYKLKVLHISLKREPFEVMVTGEKTDEFRQPTEWIKKRLFNKDGSAKKYDVVKFTNGYGPNRPQFVCEYKGAIPMIGPVGLITYSNGFTVNVPAGTYVIKLGKIGIRRNCDEFLK